MFLSNNGVPADFRPRRKLTLRKKMDNRRFLFTSRVNVTTVLPPLSADLGRGMSTNETVVVVRPECEAGQA